MAKTDELDMSDLEQQIRERYLEALDATGWDEEDPRLDFGVEALPYFLAAFDIETTTRRRARLLRVIWQFRDAAALPVLSDALRDGESAVWKEALDGLVTLGGKKSLDILIEAKTVVRAYPDAPNRLGWIDEAIEQVQEG